MKKRPGTRKHEQFYYTISQRVEGRALALIATLLVLAVIYQLLLLVPDLKKVMTTIDRLEGTPIHMQNIYKDRVG
ncbi:hypothetical protein PAECIP112173_01769 [Paenibacillus sp. JJ-100]|uniref:hypothetical protein n=1 Tax=Paenibacillus sp. JJ-100 TaxID=2974896 RepID=UPI0022FF4FC7|nr:hypothetical protein [Paenibacillus sp. JJ-100]CAI6060616.1 hypothetical protein PAECIP112173_01769 [Paenibacillus sp. JJ-100]